MEKVKEQKLMIEGKKRRESRRCEYLIFDIFEEVKMRRKSKGIEAMTSPNTYDHVFKLIAYGMRSHTPIYKITNAWANIGHK